MPSIHHLRPLLRASAPRRPATSAGFAAIRNRTYHGATVLRAYKNDQGRESLKPGPQEYSKSEGGDDGAAAESEAAFDPNQTRPETEKDAAGKGPGGNPLEVSPANPDVSKTKGASKEVSSGGDKSDKKKRSGPHTKG